LLVIFETGPCQTRVHARQPLKLTYMYTSLIASGFYENIGND